MTEKNIIHLSELIRQKAGSDSRNVLLDLQEAVRQAQCDADHYDEKLAYAIDECQKAQLALQDANQALAKFMSDFPGGSHGA